jgi:hypothetical protein
MAAIADAWWFKVVKWIAVKMFSLLCFVVSVLFFAWIGRSPTEDDDSPAPFDQKERGVDDIWSGSSTHYYENDPPDSFS